MRSHPTYRPTRRIFLADLGKVAVGLALVSTACADDSVATSTTASPPGGSTTTGGPTTSSAATSAPPSSATSSTDVPETTVPSGSANAVWERLALGGVSAYVVVRDGEAVVVDTGNPGSEDAIGDTLVNLGYGWDNVAHVVLTHRHNDHVGSVDAVMQAAAGATAYAGAEDIPSINAPREIVAVADNDSIMNLQVISTPGHTPGHISLLDADLSLLIAGDAMVGDAGGVGGPIDRFTDDLLLANGSVVKMAAFDFDTVVFGHGEPVLSGADELVRELASRL